MRTHIASALLSASSNRQGTPVPAIAKVQREMQELGLVGPDGGLTRSGSIARERAMNAALDAAF
jgi:hypothetical protein